MARLTRLPLSELPPPCGINDEDKPTSGTLGRTAFRLSGIRARDDAAESDEAMASNDDKKKARALLAANPGMKYTEALRQVQLREGPERWVVMDEVHDIKPSGEAMGRINELVRKYRTPNAQFLRFGSTLAGDPVHLLNPGARNLAVCGNAMAGHTTALRALATNAMAGGWRVSIVDPKADEYRDLRLNSERVHSPRDTSHEAHTLDQDVARTFIERLTPGDANFPHLVVIDNGDYIFTDEPGMREDDGWKEALTCLVSDPHTVVAIQCTLPVHKLLPGRILSQLKARLLLGKSTEMAQSVTFALHTPQDTLDSFTFNHPAWNGADTNRGRGVLWDGRRLQHVRTGNWTPTFEFAVKKPVTPLKDLATTTQKVVDIEPSDAAREEWERMRTLVVGHTSGDVSASPVILDLNDFKGPRSGESDDNLWVGACATEEQAIQGWEMLGQPGDRDACVSILMGLKANQLFLRERANGRTQIIEVDAAYLAALAGRRSVEE